MALFRLFGTRWEAALHHAARNAMVFPGKYVMQSAPVHNYHYNHWYGNPEPLGQWFEQVRA